MSRDTIPLQSKSSESIRRIQKFLSSRSYAHFPASITPRYVFRPMSVILPAIPLLSNDTGSPAVAGSRFGTNDPPFPFEIEIQVITCSASHTGGRSCPTRNRRNAPEGGGRGGARA